MRNALAVILAVALLSGCASISMYQTGKTIPKEKGQIGFAVGGGKTVVRTDLADFTLDLPSISTELGGGYGINEFLDVSIKYSMPATLGGMFRYGFLNEDRGAPVSMAIGAGFSYWSITTSVGSGATEHKNTASSTDVIVPLYISRDLGKAAAVYITPRFVDRIASNKQVMGSVTHSESLSTPLIGGGLGMMFSFGKDYMHHLAVEFNKVQYMKDSGIYSTQYGVALLFGI